jgi:hypothetical protein
MDVTKVDRDVAMVVYVCCKALIPMFYLCFRTYIVNVFIWMLHIFHTYAASIFIWMLHIFHTCYKCFYLNIAYVCNDFQVFFKCFRSMFQVFICLLLYVASVASECYKSRSSECSRFPSGRCESDFQRCFSNP